MALKSLKLNQLNPTLLLMSKIIGNGLPTTELEEGIFQCGHFNFEDHLEGRVYSFSDNWDRRERKEEVDLPNGLDEHGVADSIENFKEVYQAIIEDKERDFIVSFTPIVKAEQSPSGGWRWHKWGTYIGGKNPQHEYIYDEDDSIEKVFVFHVYEIKK